MGVCRIRVTVDVIAAVLRDGFRLSEILTPITEVEVLDVRMSGPPSARLIELLIESPTLAGPGSEGRWPAIAEGRWGEFPEFTPSFRVVPDRLEVPTGSLDGLREEMDRSPGRLELLPCDPREFGVHLDVKRIRLIDEGGAA